MREFTIRVYEDTLEQIDTAANNAGVSRGLFLRITLERLFDGTPHNPLGVSAAPKFYELMAEGIGTMIAMRPELPDDNKELADLRTKQILDNLEIDF